MAQVKVKMSPSEKELYYEIFRESSYMHGTNVDIHLVETTEVTDLSDIKYTYSEIKNIDIIFNERPNIYLLRNLGWYKEDSQIQPQIMYIPKKFNDEELVVKRGTLVDVPHGVIDKRDRFQVTEVRTQLDSLFWICSVVPYRYSEPPAKSQGEETRNNRWLNVDEESD